MLMMPPCSYAYGQNNLTGARDATATPPAANYGTNFTAGASSADGAVVALLTATTGDICWLTIGLAGINSTGTNAQCLADIVQDPAGGTAWASLIDDLVCGFTLVPGSAGQAIGLWYHFPIWIKSGSTLGIRAKTRHTADITTGRCVIYAYGEPSRPDAGFWVGQKVESLGNGANSQGVDVTPGSTGTWGSWTTIGTSTQRYGFVQYGINGSDGTATANGYYWQLGYGSSQMPSCPTIFTNNDINEKGQRHGAMMPMWCDVPASTAWQIRATCDGTAEAHNACVYGVY